MSRLKVLTSIQMCQLVERMGFILVRQKGSHCFFRHSDGRTTVVPMHAGDIDRALIRKILKDMELSIEEYNRSV